MNANRLINMVIRQITNLAAGKGAGLLAGKGKPQSEMTPAERDQALKAQELTKRAQKSMRVGRRMGRF